MPLDLFESALKSLDGWPTLIGIIGGEPTLHPQFSELCALALEYIPAEKLRLFTAGGRRYEEHKSLINRTFKGGVKLNRHTKESKAVCLHQPSTIAVGDVVLDPVVRNKLIDSCWVQRDWCPAISQNGAFFCEIACALDMLLDLGGGYAIELGWWRREVADFQDQVKKYCDLCGMVVPMGRELQNTKKEKFSRTLLAMFRERNLAMMDDEHIELFDRIFTVEEIMENSKNWEKLQHIEFVSSPIFGGIGDDVIINAEFV